MLKINRKAIGTRTKVSIATEPARGHPNSDSCYFSYTTQSSKKWLNVLVEATCRAPRPGSWKIDQLLPLAFIQSDRRMNANQDAAPAHAVADCHPEQIPSWLSCTIGKSRSSGDSYQCYGGLRNDDRGLAADRSLARGNLERNI